MLGYSKPKGPEGPTLNPQVAGAARPYTYISRWAALNASSGPAKGGLSILLSGYGFESASAGYRCAISDRRLPVQEDAWVRAVVLSDREILCPLAWSAPSPTRVQGHLAHKKQPPRRTLQWAYA